MNAYVWPIVLTATLLTTAGFSDEPPAVSTNSPPATVGPSVTGTSATNSGTGSIARSTPGVSGTNSGPGSVASDAELTNIEPPKLIRPAAHSLPPLLDQVVRMAERGTDETVLKAYIDSAAAYNISGNDIIQLQDLGVSQSIILALVQRSKGVSIATTSEQPVVSAIDASQPAPTAVNVASTVVQPPATPPTEYYDALAPYGSWYDVPGYGYCWQPTVVVFNSSWRPYSDSGNWMWSDYGWYWNSYYSWGWAPFHYGRWFSHAGRGWLWCPDRVWGPAWVTWRNSGSHCGWAPLPPGAHFAGGGWTYRGARVGAHFDFGLGNRAFTFVRRDRFVDRHVGRSAVAARDADSVFRGSSVDNNHTVRGDNRLFNAGVPRSSVAGGNVPARRVAGAAAGRVANNSVDRNVGRSAVAGRSTPAVGRNTTPLARATAPSGNPNVTAFANRTAPLANSGVRRTAPLQQGIRQQSPVQVFPRPGSPRVAPQPMARAMPNTVQRAAPMRGMPTAPRYSAPAAAPRYAAPAGGRSFGSSGTMSGGFSRGSVAPRGGGSMGGGRGGAMHSGRR